MSLGIDPFVWPELSRLLDLALDMPAAEREAWLATLESTDSGLKTQLRQLLGRAASVETNDLLHSMPRLEAEWAPPSTPSSGSGTEIGPYRLILELGSGGMGSVWLAERADGLMRRPVALKLPHRPCQSARRAVLMERLSRERDILATLNHPHIARLYDAGLTEDGQPYLALEYVEGIRIDAYCHEHRLSIPDRLRLFLQVVDAVAHAHSKLTVHRDLKPANILVTSDRQARLLDFGIAKLLEDGAANETELTRMTGRALTPDYASPEQVRGDTIGTASDIYSLGVVLFELLTGKRPYQLRRTSAAALEEAVLEAEAPNPSTATDDPGLRKMLRGDLDTIVRKALNKQPEHRYATANMLADDIERHLSSRPVQAQPDSGWYRLRKFVRRHRVPVAAGTAVAIGALASLAAMLWQAHLAIVERRRAEDIKAFVTSIFRDADPYQRANEPLSVVGLLHQARARVDRELAGRPDQQVEMLILIGESLKNLQATDEAAQTLDRAVAVAGKSLVPGDRLSLEARVARLGLLRFQGHAEQLRNELAQLLPLLRTKTPDTALLIPALLMQGHQDIDDARYDHAVAIGREALDLASRNSKPDDALTATCATVLALALEYAHQLDEARQVGARAVQLALAAHAGNTQNAEVIDARETHARILGELGQLAQAIDEIEQTVTAARAHFGEDAIEVGFFQHSMIKFLLEAGAVERARRLAEEDIAIFTKHREPGTYFEPVSRMTRANTHLAYRDGKSALADAQYARHELLGILPAEHPFVLRASVAVALAFAYQGRFAEASSQMESLPATLADQGAQLLVSRARATVAHLRGNDRQAVAAARSALSGITGPRSEVDSLQVLPVLGLALMELGEVEEARNTLTRTLALSERLQIEDSPERADAWYGLGRIQAEVGECAAARPLLQRAADFWARHAAAAAMQTAANRWLERCRSNAP
jgi:eukaryotic-like serine/threonine-protein kinase